MAEKVKVAGHKGKTVEKAREQLEEWLSRLDSQDNTEYTGTHEDACSFAAEPLTIDANTPIEVAMEEIEKWLKPLNLLRLAGKVAYKWLLFQRRPAVTFQFFTGEQSSVEPNDWNITVHDPAILKELLRDGLQNLQIPELVNNQGVGVEDAVRNHLSKICRFNGPKIIKPILHRVMSKWMLLPGEETPDIPIPNIPVRFDNNADDRQIDVMKESHGSISPIPWN